MICPNSLELDLRLNLEQEGTVAHPPTLSADTSVTASSSRESDPPAPLPSLAVRLVLSRSSTPGTSDSLSKHDSCDADDELDSSGRCSPFAPHVRNSRATSPLHCTSRKPKHSNENTAKDTRGPEPDHPLPSSEMNPEGLGTVRLQGNGQVPIQPDSEAASELENSEDEGQTTDHVLEDREESEKVFSPWRKAKHEL